jgi:ribonuclease G
MSKNIIINAGIDETRIALCENDLLVELYIERKRDRGIVGNIYKGNVTRVLPGIQAAFVDIGLEKDVFLYVMDVHENIDEFEKLLGENEENDECEDNLCCLSKKDTGKKESKTKEGGSIPRFSIEDVLTEGQDIIIKI